MGKIYQCVGHYAETAYTIRRTWIHIYSVEELCYYICNNAYLLEDDFINQDLLMWLESDCMLPALVKTIRQQIRQGARLEEQIRILLELVHYCPSEEIDEITGMISVNHSMNSLQKNKIRADYFLKNERYAMALQSYEALQDELQETSDKELLASVYYNMGVIYAHLFLFEQAAEFFDKAYKEYGKQEYQVAYLAANRMMLQDGEYVEFIGKREETFRASGVLEDQMEKISKDWKLSDQHMNIREMGRQREGGSFEMFMKQAGKLNNACKEQYRNMILE